MSDTIQTTATNTAQVAVNATNQNYVAGMYKKLAQGPIEYGDFFVKNFTGNQDIETVTNEIKKQAKKISELQTKLASLYTGKYTLPFTKAQRRTYLYYEPRHADVIYFSFPDGQAVLSTKVDEYKKTNACDLILLEQKVGETKVVTGYCFDLGSIITTTYLYTISPDNKLCKLTPYKEELESFMENKKVTNVIANTKQNNHYWYREPFERTNGAEFLNGFFGVNLNSENTRELKYYKQRFEKNKSFEIIIKTAPEDLRDRLLEEDIKDALPVHKLLGIDKSIYEECIKQNVTLDMFYLKSNLQFAGLFHMTPQEWVDMIQECKRHEEDLKFYNITFDIGYGYGSNIDYRAKTSRLLILMAAEYRSRIEFQHYYSFGKFVNYCVYQTINQGYTDIKNFTKDLRDYLLMCDSHRIKPSCYTSYLKLTHDIAARNYKITVTPEQEQQFKDRYSNWNNIKIKDYCIIAPKESNDLKDEGNQLNHCVGSYIKRVIDGESVIYFMRKDKERDTSLITIEVKDGVIIQVRGASNRLPNKEEIDIVDEFAKKCNLTCSYSHPQ